MPLVFEGAIPLRPVRSAVLRGPDGLACGVVFAQDGDLAVIQEDMIVRQGLVGALGTGVDGVAGVVEAFEEGWRMGGVWWEGEVEFEAG